MKGYKTVDEYILNVAEGREKLIVLRDLIRSTELTETVKWGVPVYTIKDLKPEMPVFRKSFHLFLKTLG